MDELCPIHQVPFKLVPAGTSKTTGKPYSAFMACPERGCREKPRQQQTGWTGVRQQVAEKVAPGKAAMTREDWEARDRKRNSEILLQVAFKAAVELASSGKLVIHPEAIKDETLKWHSWLLSQTQGSSATSEPAKTTPAVQNIASSGGVEETVNAAIDAARGEMEYGTVDGSEIDF